MNKINISYFTKSDRTESAEKLAANLWMLISMGEPKKFVTVPITERKQMIRAAAWIETHDTVIHLPGLHAWGDLDASFSDDHGIAYIHSGYNGEKKFPVPATGWALLKVRNDEWFLDKPRQERLPAENVDENPDDWRMKMDYVDGLTKGIGFLVFTGNPERKSDITLYIRQVLANMALPTKERVIDKQNRIEGGHIRKGIYQIMKGQQRSDGVTTEETKLDVDPEPTPGIPVRALTKTGKAVVIDLAKIEGDVQFSVLRDGAEVTGYQPIWSNNPDHCYDLSRANILKYSRDPHFQLKANIEKGWIIREETNA